MHQRDLFAEAREKIGLFHGGVAAAHHHDLLAAIKEAVTSGATRYAVADELLLVGEVEPARRRARGNDERAGFEPLVIHFEAEGALGKVGFDDRAVQVIGAEVLGLLLDVFHQHGAVDALGKSWEIFDQRGERELAAGLVSSDHEGFQIGSRGVDGGGVSGAAGADDDDVVHWKFYASRDYEMQSG